MNFFKVVLDIFFPMINNKEIDFDNVIEDYYLSEPEVNMTGNSLNGGDIYHEPDYVINH